MGFVEEQTGISYTISHPKTHQDLRIQSFPKLEVEEKRDFS